MSYKFIRNMTSIKEGSLQGWRVMRCEFRTMANKSYGKSYITLQVDFPTRFGARREADPRVHSVEEAPAVDMLSQVDYRPGKLGERAPKGSLSGIKYA